MKSKHVTGVSCITLFVQFKTASERSSNTKQCHSIWFKANTLWQAREVFLLKYCYANFLSHLRTYSLTRSHTKKIHFFFQQFPFFFNSMYKIPGSKVFAPTITFNVRKLFPNFMFNSSVWKIKICHTVEATQKKRRIRRQRLHVSSLKLKMWQILDSFTLCAFGCRHCRVLPLLRNSEMLILRYVVTFRMLSRTNARHLSTE